MVPHAVKTEFEKTRLLSLERRAQTSLSFSLSDAHVPPKDQLLEATQLDHRVVLLLSKIYLYDTWFCSAAALS